MASSPRATAAGHPRRGVAKIRAEVRALDAARASTWTDAIIGEPRPRAHRAEATSALERAFQEQITQRASEGLWSGKETMHIRRPHGHLAGRAPERPLTSLERR